MGGGIVGYFNSAAISTGIPSLLTLPIFYGEGFGGLTLGICVSFVLAAVLTWIVGFEDIPEEQPQVSDAAAISTPVSTLGAEQITAPMSGVIVPLEQVNDKVFSSGVVGDGVAIRPDGNQVFSPVDGTLSATFDSGHALQIISVNGAEVLIHVGLDTVQLNGEHYRLHVRENQQVKRGDLLLEFDREAIEKAGYDTITPVIVYAGHCCQCRQLPSGAKIDAIAGVRRRNASLFILSH